MKPIAKVEVKLPYERNEINRPRIKKENRTRVKLTPTDFFL